MKNIFGRRLLLAAAAVVALMVMAVQCMAAAMPEKEAAHLARLNEARAANGLPALKLSTELTEAAKVRAQEITSKFSHDRPNNTKFFTAIANQTGWNGISENIASGKGLDTAYNAVDVLMASAGHRANILTKDNVCVGVATYQDTNGEYFWVEIFAAVRPSRDADKAAEGSESEPTFVQSVNDPTLTVDGAGVHQTKDGTVDYFGGKQRSSLAELIRESQKKGNYTLVGTWHTLCGNINDFQVQAEAHKRKERTTIQGTKRTITMDSDATLPRLFELNNVDVILVNPMGNYEESIMQDAINSYWPSYSASSSVWGNTLCLRTANNQQNTIGTHYGNLVGKSGTPAEPALFLYKDGKMVAKSLGLHQSNTFDQWAKKIASLQQGRTPNDSGTGGNTGSGGSGDSGGGTGTGGDSDNTGGESGSTPDDGGDTGGDAEVVISHDIGLTVTSPDFNAPENKEAEAEAIAVTSGGEVKLYQDDGTTVERVFNATDLVSSFYVEVEHPDNDDKSITVAVSAEPGSSFSDQKDFYALVKQKDDKGGEYVLFPCTRVSDQQLSVVIAPVGDFFSGNTILIYSGTVSAKSSDTSAGSSGGGGCTVGASAVALGALSLIRRRKR